MKTKKLNISKAISLYYLWLSGNSPKNRRDCSMTTHPLYPYRLGELPEDKTYLDRRKAVRQHCIECSGGNPGEVNDCIFKDCQLYNFRHIRNK